MESVGQLAGGIAHDFNNILTAVLGYCDLLLDRVGSNEALASDLKQIREGGNRAAALTRQLLAFSRKQVLRLEVADLNLVLERFQNLVRPMIGEDIELTLGMSETPALLEADVAQLEQVAMNLVVNARDAMPDGGAIRMRTAHVTVDETAPGHNDQAMSAGAYVQLVVEDTGIGMTQETRLRLFEPFFTTKAPGKGTGLGLAVVYGIVKQMGGFIWVYSEEGRGTTFKLYFPRAEQPGVPSDAASDPDGARRGNERILLVEDDADVRTFAGRVLRRSGYEVSEASSGMEALGHLEQGPQPHLVLTDMIMPGMSGRDLAGHVAKRYPGIRILFTSGYPDHRIVSGDGLDREVNLIEKPFSARSLLSRVRKALDRPDSRAT
jgi:CheY-like chemotaxis protein